MGEGALFASLTALQDGPGPLQPIEELLGTGHEAAIDRLFVPLLHHKTLLTAFSRLERAGGDLHRLTLSAELFPSVPPLNQVLPQAVPREHRVSLARVRDELQRLQLLNRQIIWDLVDRNDHPPFLVLSGRAFDAAYPRYRHRMDFDSDLFVPTLSDGIELAETIADRFGFGLKRFRVSRFEEGGLAWVGLVRTTPDDFRMNVGFFIGGCLLHRGGQLQWMELPLWERSREASWNERTVRVPSAEDMVLLAVARIRRKGMVTRRDRNDLQFLLQTEGERLDWDYIIQASAQHHLGETIRFLTADAQTEANRRLIPEEVAPRLDRGAVESFLHRRTHLQAPSERPSVARRYPKLRSPLGRMWENFAFMRSVGAKTGRIRAVGQLAWLAIRKTAFRLEWKVTHRGRRSGAGAGLSLGPLRPGYGSLCEFAEPAVPQMSSCLSQRHHRIRGRPRWAPDSDVWDRLVGLLRHRGENLSPTRTRFDRHQCWMFLVDLSGIHSKDRRVESRGAEPVPPRTSRAISSIGDADRQPTAS